MSRRSGRTLIKVNLHNKLAPHLGPGEDVLWAVQTDMDGQQEMITWLKQEIRNDRNFIVWIVSLLAIVWIVFPAYWSLLICFAVIIGSQSVFNIVWTRIELTAVRNFDIGAYALTQSHFFELDQSLGLKNKYDASKARHALSGDSGHIISPLGPRWSARYQLYFVPETASLNQLQSALDRARSMSRNQCRNTGRF